MNNTRKIAIACFLLTTLGLLSACGTIKGFGQDVSRTGRDIQRAAS
ncbi:entericidin A/B family lipoprotein [Legionella fairfieldensis]|nr:entericidin A/B family lipoprotein [Legionella fairfieldensis]